MRRIRSLELVFVLLLTLSVAAVAENEIPVFNGDFETLPPNATEEEVLGKWPFGWVVTHQPTASQFHIGITDELAFDGTYSLLIRTDEREGGILIESRPIPVEEGKTYAALLNVFNINEPPLYTSTPHLYIQFWGENAWWGDRDYWSEEAWRTQQRGQWSTRTRLHTEYKGNYETGKWVEILVIAEAPEGTKYATLGLWTVNRTMKAYVDGVRFAVLE